MASPLVTVDVHLREDDLQAALEADVRAGMSRSPKSIPPTWFYDEEGSRLFDEITRLPEYYPTRAERRLLERHAADVASAAATDSLVELGAGSCDKTRLLLDALAARRQLRHYVPLDVSEQFLRAAAHGVADDYPGLRVRAVVGDFRQHLSRIPATGTRLIAFLGGTIGNLVPDERHRFLAALRSTMGADDRLLLGADLVKAPARIVAAYDDARGVTAAFNRNVLYVLNHTLDADFRPDRFEHVVRWDSEASWIEMRLRSVCAQHVAIPRIGLEVDFAPGEDVLTEISAKFTATGLATELGGAGFAVDHQWGATEGEFLLVLARPDA